MSYPFVHQKSTGRSPKIESSREALHRRKAYDLLNEQIDDSAIALFNAFAADVRPHKDPFVFRTTDIPRARRILESWAPQKYETRCVRSEADVPYVLSNFFKRFLSTEESNQVHKLEAKAARKFLETNFDGNAIDDYTLNHPIMAPLITKMRYLISDFFSPVLDMTELYTLVGHGPNRTTDLEFCESYLHNKNRAFAGTRPALQQFVLYLHWDHNLREQLCAENDSFRSLINSLDIFNVNGWRDEQIFQLVELTVTSFVPKSYDSLRTMCPEPTLNAFWAKAFALWITQRLIDYCNIDLSTQPEVHRRLAKIGSLYAEACLGTVDWSEASDRIWRSLVSCCMSEGQAPRWFTFMDHLTRVGNTSVEWRGIIGANGDFVDKESLVDFLCTRTDSYTVTYKTNKSGVTRYSVAAQVRTTMFATMGNPVTFPLQTLFFWAFLTACTELASDRLGMELNPPSSFGDDGIVDTRAMQEVEYYAPLLEWKLNRNKSFTTGVFRESCGGDFIAGREVRPFMMKRPPVSLHNSEGYDKRLFTAWLYVCVNNLHTVTQKLGYDGSNLIRCLERLFKQYQLGKICLIPPSFSEGSGLRVIGHQQVYEDVLNVRNDDMFGNLALKAFAQDIIYDRGPFGLWPSDIYHTVIRTESMFHFRALDISNETFELTDDDVVHHYIEKLRSNGSRGVEYHTKYDVFSIHKRPVISDHGKLPEKASPSIRYKRVTSRFWQ